MKNNSKICSALLATLFLAVSVHAKEWRGIVPLHSSRDDVHRILGKPKSHSQNGLFDHYRPNDEEYVNIGYATEPCLGLTYYWGNYAVPANTVLKISVSYEHGFPVANLNISNFEALKREVDHSLTIYYFDAEQGVEYSVQDGKVTGIEYGPAKLDSYLRCPDKESPLSRRPTTRWTGAAGACFASSLVRRRCVKSRRPVNSDVGLLLSNRKGTLYETIGPTNHNPRCHAASVTERIFLGW